MAKLLVLPSVEPPVIMITAGVANVAATMDCVDAIVITHGLDGEHKVGSLHRLYAAVDIRTKNLKTEVDKTNLYFKLMDKFRAPRYDVLFEDRGGVNEHIHIEDNYAKRNLPPVRT